MVSRLKSEANMAHIGFHIKMAIVTNQSTTLKLRQHRAIVIRTEHQTRQFKFTFYTTGNA